uniref:F-box domain-containing protein n=1 Tax=Wuchereria bancrofti TaxID=6293 RepID=A0A1I8EED9_WUCBA
FNFHALNEEDTDRFIYFKILLPTILSTDPSVISVKAQMNSEASGIPSTSVEFMKMSSGSDANITYRMQLASLPESVIYRVLSYLSHPELLQAQRVNKQFYRLVRRNVHLLCRPEVMEMGIGMCGCEKRARPFGRLQTSLVLKASRRRRLFVKFTRKTPSVVKYREIFKDEDYTGDRNDLSENLLSYLDQQFKEANIHGILSFSGIAITTDLYNNIFLKQQLRKILFCKFKVPTNIATKFDHNKTVFTLCHFRLPLEYLYELLIRTHCQRLTIELSYFEQCFLDDLVLEAMSECQELILSSATPVYFSRFTDNSLHRWAVQEKLPKKILLRNIRTNFTFDGVITLINALQIRYPELFSNTVQSMTPVGCWRKTVYDWDFGCITLPEQNEGNSIVELLSIPGVVTHISPPRNVKFQSGSNLVFLLKRVYKPEEVFFEAFRNRNR